ncbi:hypothetical protein HNR42_001317 [Deinobacterium chartae]|uniref:DUF2239 family protein n=1 Tax=Deinobacterium chartae TaxID=521158 RepID=A0A841HYZ8_9DEIO|nr:hypothetical protein [Deinobacterium chartae]
MNDPASYTAFANDRKIASGPLADLLRQTRRHLEQFPDSAILIFEDHSGKQVDFDLSGTLEQVLARALPPQPPARRGRPKLGVVSREISLLPRHWEWLEQQPVGASATLRRMIDEARKQGSAHENARRAAEATDRLMSALAGNRPGYEEAARALYAGDRAGFCALIEAWPEDIRTYLHQRSLEAFSPAEPTDR